jgi:NADH-quinone oxidoreductase subunit K
LLQGQVFALFVMVIAAAEAALALAIVLRVYQLFRTSRIDELTSLKG